MKAIIRLTIASLALGSLLTIEVRAAGSGPSLAPKAPKEIRLYNQGVELMEKGKYEKAVQKFERALERRDEIAEAHNNLAYCLRKISADNFERSLEHYNRAIELDPQLAQAYAYRGTLFVLQGQSERAEADYRALRELNPALAAELRQVIDSGAESPEKAQSGTSGTLEGGKYY